LQVVVYFEFADVCIAVVAVGAKGGHGGRYADKGGRQLQVVGVFEFAIAVFAVGAKGGHG
jgi:hypothetical protein